MFKVGFFYKKHTILDEWVSITRDNVVVPSGVTYVNLYVDVDNNNALMAVTSEDTDISLIDNRKYF